MSDNNYWAKDINVDLLKFNIIINHITRTPVIPTGVYPHMPIVPRLHTRK